MKRWAFLVAGLYLLALITLTLPVVSLAFAPHWPGVNEIKKAFTIDAWPYWTWLAVMLISQLCLLVVPVKTTHDRPISRRTLLWPIITGGFLSGLLAIGAGYSIFEFVFKGKSLDAKWPSSWIPIFAGALTWIIWSNVFYRQTREQSADNVVRKQSYWLLRGSILELLIAVPTHIVARYRGYCCAGFMTFIGITFGIAVMLLAFGPSVFFLFVARWKRLHPPASSGRL